MKPQDLGFFALLAILIFIKKPRLTLVIALLLLLASMPLFQFWIFFTAQRFVTYAFFLILLTIIQIIVKNRLETTE